MSITAVKRFTVSLAVVAVAACASNQAYESSGGTVDLANYPVRSLSASELQNLRGMSDATILGHIATVDSMEVVTADSLLRISKTSDVVEYANMMHVAHATHFQRTRAIGKETGVTPTGVYGGIRASHIAAALDSVRFASDLTVDHHYISSQIMLHEHVLAELEQLQSVAQNQAIRDHIASTIPAVRDHLVRAHAIAISKGYEKKR